MALGFQSVRTIVLNVDFTTVRVTEAILKSKQPSFEMADTLLGFKKQIDTAINEDTKVNSRGVENIQQ